MDEIKMKVFKLLWC